MSIDDLAAKPADKSGAKPTHVVLLGDHQHHRAGKVLAAEPALLEQLAAAKVKHRAATAAEIEIGFQH